MNVKEPAQATVAADDRNDPKGKLKIVGGSHSDHWNNILANQTINTLWLAHSDDEKAKRQTEATVSALVGIAPQDELEGMMAAQLLAAHNAAMECYRRAMLSEQTFEGRNANLAQANKLSRSFAALLEALNRHRGKGQQKVTVEHVHVHSGGQAIVGTVERQTPHTSSTAADQHHVRQVTHAFQPTMQSPHAERELVSGASDDERPLPDAWGKIARCPEGE